MSKFNINCVYLPKFICTTNIFNKIFSIELKIEFKLEISFFDCVINFQI